MASYNSTFFLCVLVAISALMAATPSTAIVVQLTPVFSITDMIIVQGLVYCKINVTLSPNGAVLGNPPPFPNAPVQLRCGDTVLANTTTNAVGMFSSVLDPLQNTVQNLLNVLVGPLSNCKLVVTTPLASCNVSLPGNGFLESNLTSGTTDSFNGLFRIFNVNPAGFRLSN